MNILMVGPDSFAKGGIATVIANFKAHYKTESVTFLTTWTEERPRLSGIKAFFQIRKHIRKKKINIVHFHVAQRGSFFRKALLAKLIPRKCKVIFHMHASQFDTFYNQSPLIVKKWIRRVLDSLDGIVALSSEWQNFYQTISSVPIKVIENAVKVAETNVYNPFASQITTFGRIGKRKGSYDILEVAQQIEPLFPNVHFVLYGDGETKQLQAKIQEKRLKNVKIGGWVDATAKEAILKKTVLHLLPSYQEGLPMAILETLAVGIPNLTSNVGGIPQVIQDQQNGFMVPPGDITLLTEKLLFFLTDEAQRKNMSEAAFLTIQQNFSLDAYFDKWTTFYQELVTREKY